MKKPMQIGKLQQLHFSSLAFFDSPIVAQNCLFLVHSITQFLCTTACTYITYSYNTWGQRYFEAAFEFLLDYDFTRYFYLSILSNTESIRIIKGWNELGNVEIFWEGHKNLTLLSKRQNNRDFFFKYCCLLTTYQLWQSMTLFCTKNPSI